jgi:UPF0755 protein
MTKTHQSQTKPLLIVTAVSGLALGLLSGFSWFWWSWASAPMSHAASAPSKTIQIPHGTSIDQIGRELEAAGLIRSAKAWNLRIRWLSFNQKEGNVQAGTYKISPNQSLDQVVARIWGGDVVQESLTLPEGWSLRRMAQEFEAKGMFPAQDFLTASQKIPYQTFPWLPPNLPHLEGFLYPDTYKLPSGQATPEQVIEQMLRQFEAVALPIYQQHPSKSSLSLLEWVTLSSIVEKEAVIASERPLIAGVFLRRLQLGMPLGADPTVEYALNIQQTPDKPLTYQQVKVKSPYNTYLNSGLPPTPISNPGVESLKAVLTPEKTSYLYFVARYDGSHIFSKTLNAHESAQRDVHRQRKSERS